MILVFFELDVGIGSGINAVDHIDGGRALLLWLIIDAATVVMWNATVQHRATTTSIRKRVKRHTYRHASTCATSGSAADAGDAGRCCRATNSGDRQCADGGHACADGQAAQ